MKRSKITKGNVLEIILTIIASAFIIGGIFYYFFHREMNEFEEEIEELKRIQEEDVVEKLNLKIEENCLKVLNVTVGGKTAAFDYPCDWEKDIKPSDMLSSGGTIVSPDRKASLTFPMPPTKISGTQVGEIEGQEVTTIQGKTYLTKGYKVDDDMIIVVDMSETFGEGVKLLLAYQDLDHAILLEKIVETMEF
jgi:hypothetical protein